MDIIKKKYYELFIEHYVYLQPKTEGEKDN